MKSSDVVVGLDIGSSQIRLVVATKEENRWRVLSVSKNACTGLRKGVVVNIEDTAVAINKAVETAERVAGVPVERAIINIGGSHVLAHPARSKISVSRPDGEVGPEDVNRAISTAESIISRENFANREIIHVVPKSFSLDNQSDIPDPIGMNGSSLELDALIITGSTPFIRNLGKCVNQAGIEIEDVVASPLAAAQAVLNRRQKELGVALINIGMGTTDLAVYEEDQLIFTSSLPIGAGHITNDIAIVLKTSIEVAEKVKLEYGFAVSKDISAKKEINLSKISKSEEGNIKAKEIAEIIEARMEEIFRLINKELKKIKRDGMLPAGVVFTGGGAKLPGIVDLAKKILLLPAQIGFPVKMEGMSESLDDPAFAVVVGLLLSVNQEKIRSGGNIWEKVKGAISVGLPFSLPAKGKGFSDSSQTVDKIKEWFKTFLP